MKLNNLFLFLVLTLLFSSTVCTQKGICRFCGIQCTNLEEHEQYCRKIDHKLTQGGTCEFCKGAFSSLKKHEERCPFNPNGLKKSPCPHCKRKVKYLKKHYKYCHKKPVDLNDKQLVQRLKISKSKKTQAPPLVYSVGKIVEKTLIKKKNNNQTLNPPKFDTNRPPSSIFAVMGLPDPGDENQHLDIFSEHDENFISSDVD